MTAEIIVPLNVDGTVLQTSSLTMLKYPNSKLARFYNEQEGQSQKNFLDADAEYFWIVLNFLRNGEVFPFDEEKIFGVRNLAKNLEFAELVKFLERQDGFSTVVLDIGREKEIKMTRNFLTRVPESHLAKIFSGEQGSENPLSDYIYICSRLAKKVTSSIVRQVWETKF